MFRATKPFKNTVTGYDKEPSLRIGARVPQNAVNLAYYYNPTATKSEKILASDPPRLTIDHKVETQWLTKLDQAAGPNGEEPSIDLFPKSLYYSDEEGYYGRLARQDETVKWYPEKHVDQKQIEYDSIQIVDKKGDEDKTISWSDADGYKGNLYLDTSSYEVYSNQDVSVTEELDYSINDFELNYHDIFDSYLTADDINNGPWMNEPNPMTGEDYCWPARIDVTPLKLQCSDTGLVTTNTNNKIANFVNKLTNDWEGSVEYKVDDTDVYESSKPVGILYFDKLEYEPVGYNTNPTNGTTTKERKVSGIKTDNFNWNVTADLESYQNYYPGFDKVKINNQDIKKTYLADMGKEYDEIYDFIDILESIGNHQTAVKELNNAIDDGKDIAIWLSDLSFIVNDKSIDMLVDGNNIEGTDENEIDAVLDPSACHFEVGYKYVISDKGTEGTILYNVTANYHSITLNDGTCSVKRTVKTKKTIAGNYRAHCHYSGIADKNWVDYDGIAFYMGAVTKGNAVGNQNADGDNEILMFPDESGYLRQIVEGIETTTDENNRQVVKTVYKDYYSVEADTVYVTDVFKNGEACFYKYRLKQPIYDYRGPDSNGFYKGDAVQIFTSTLKNVPSNYAHNIKLIPSEYEDKETYDEYNNKIITQIPKCYFAELYTNFISNSTDTFKVIYNGFNNNNIMENGIEEDIYNFPFMINGIDYQLKKFSKKTRLNYIQIPDYRPLEDQRLRVTFTWIVKAINKEKDLQFISEERQSSILNKDYALPCEYNKFEDRGMIISPNLNGDSIPASPMDICLYDQANYQSSNNSYQPIIKSGEEKDFIYIAEITNVSNQGSVNLKCNPDGSGVITAETTVPTGFYDDTRMSYTKKLDLENPYWIDDSGKYIFKGYKVKCIDTRNIKVKAPREEKLLDSWYPMIQFGHFSRVMDQYGVGQKVCYSMPEYDTQHYSQIYGQPFIDIKNEKLEILNPHMVKTLCYPLHILCPNLDTDTYFYDGKFYKVFIKKYTWQKAEEECLKIGGHLAMPKTDEIKNFFVDITDKYNIKGVWLGGIYDLISSEQKYSDGSVANNDFSIKGQSSNQYLEMSCSGDYESTKGTLYVDNNDSVFPSGYICEFTGTIEVFKKVDNELFKLNIKDISFTDGVIILKETISENDNIVANYTYLEENYHYRGYWRSDDDFLRIDLNPNIYHTYTDPKFLPGETSPSKNLFNKVIYFFLRPSGIYEVSSDQDNNYSKDRFKKVETEKTIYKEIFGPVEQEKVVYKEVEVTKTKKVTKLKLSEEKILGSDTFQNTDKETGKPIVNVSKIVKNDKEIRLCSFVVPDENITPDSQSGIIELVSNHPFNRFKLIRYDNYDDWKSDENGEIKGYGEISGWTYSFEDQNTGEWITTYQVNDLLFGFTKYDNDESYYDTNRNCENKNIFTIVVEPDPSYNGFSTYHLLDPDIPIKTVLGKTVEDEEYIDTEIQPFIEMETVNKWHTVEEKYKEVELVPNELIQKIISENDDCLYHKIDDAEPDSDEDILIGSVYIRQNTSLHSTMITDSRTRGGGILTGISESLRQELEPESDFYLDIGYYDGKPYQENGTIIVRLDKKILKEYGGRFTIGDIEQKVKRWLGIGIYPIIEFVDSYQKRDLPQYNLEVQDSYTNVVDFIPEVLLECIEI